MEAITLKEFIKDTLVEITTGIHDANQELHQAKKVPYTNTFILRPNKGDSSKILGIQFDVAITAGTNKAGEAGIRIALASIGIGAKREDTASNEMVHRIKFEVVINTEIS